MNPSTAGPWALRAVWAALPVTVGPALGDALDPRSLAVGRTGASLAWVIWAVGLLAVVLPHTIGLAAIRTAVPTVLAVAVWAALEVDGGAAAIGAVITGAVLVLAAFAPTTGDFFVNASSYGDERRMPLKVPGALVLGPLALTWAAVVAPIVFGPLLLAAEQWVLGGVVLAIGGPVVVIGARALHSLAKRWVVFVPAGMVLHDHQAMLDPVLFPKRLMAQLGPAVIDDSAPQQPVDLTQGSFGLALQLELTEPLAVAPRTSRAAPEVVEVTALRFTPTRPGALLAEARARKLPVG